MSLEGIAKQYGMNDYFDIHTGKIYALSEFIDNEDGTLKIPVYSLYGDVNLIGYAKMNKVN